MPTCRRRCRILTISCCGISVENIDFSISFRAFKDHPFDDAYALFFLRNIEISGRPEWARLRNTEFRSEDVNTAYKLLPLADLHKAAMAFFAPSKLVMDRVDRLRISSGLSADRTIAILYRGTDKYKEVALAPIEDYIEVAWKLMRENPEFEVFVQTDQLQARDAVLQAFPGKAKFFQELPVTDADTVIHELDIPEIYGIGRCEFTARLMAATILLSGCRFLINHTGNVALWAMIHRGTAQGVFQFSSTAELIEPP